VTAINASLPFNVEATLNAYMRTQLATYPLTSWMAALPPVVTDWPIKTTSMPAFSIAHIDVGGDDRYQGRNVGNGNLGMMTMGIMDVSAWVTKSNTNWLIKLRTMESMIMDVLVGQATVVIKDYYTNQVSPSNTAYRLTLGNVRRVSVAQDPNPDVQRRRVLVNYDWVMRS